jgi:hypothetical protein
MLCRFTSVEDLGSPDDAAARILDKYLNKEFMSTRIGIKREGEIVSAASRQGSDGKMYYDIEVSSCTCSKACCRVVRCTLVSTCGQACCCC